MKSSRNSLFLPWLAGLMPLVLGASNAEGATFWWDGGTANIGGNGDGASTGGNGTWNTSIQNWDRGAGQTYIAWPNASDTAVFGGAAGTVTIADATTINVNSLVFNSGYTIAGANASTSVLNFSGTTPSISGGSQSIISARITGSSGLSVASGSYIILNGNLSGLGGTVNIGGGGTGRINLGPTSSGSQFQTWNVNSGATLSSNYQGTNATIQLGALSGAGTLRIGNTGSPSLGGTDIFEIGALNTSTLFSGNIINFNSGGLGLTGVTKVGTGTLTLTGTGNTYTGGTTISAGTLEIGNGSTNGSMSGNYSIGNTGTLRLNYATAAAPAWSNITGTGTLSIRSAAPNSDWGSPALASGFTGTLQIESGRLNNGTLGNATSVVVQNGGQYANWNGGTFAQNFTVAGTGWGESGYESSLRLGNTTINGTVNLAGSTTIGSGGTALFTNVISGGTGSQLTIGTPALASSVAFSGANTYSGGTNIAAGALSVGQLVGNSAIEGSSTSLGTGAVNVSAGAQLVLAGNNISIGNSVTLNGAGTVGGRQGALMGGFQDGGSANTLSGTLTLAGTGDRTVSTWWSDKTLTLSGKVTGTGNLRIVNATNGGNGGSIVILGNTTNDYSGNTIVDGGGNGSTQTLRLGANNVIPDGAGKGDLFVDGRFELNGFNETVNGIGAGSGVISLSSGNTLTVGNNNANGDTFTVLTGLGNFTKIGSGTQILRGTSDFSGTTTISGGTLQVSVNGTTASLGSGDIINNATLAFQRQNDITVNNAISGTGAVSQIGTGTLVLAGTNKTYTGATNVNSGTLQLTGSLSNSAISVASGARFSPTVTTSAGLSTGTAGARLALNSGSIFDMTSTSAGTINTFTLNPGANTFSGQALSLAGANLRFDLGSGSADRLTVNSGTAAVSGTNNIRLNTGSSLTPGTYTLISAASGLAGNFQFDGGGTLSVPALQQIRNVGGTYHRLTLQNSGTAQQVVVSAAPSNVINIMPLGSSITEGVSSEGSTYNGGGYRSQLYQNLVNDGRFTPHFVGSQTALDASNTTGYNVLTGANELNHEGHSGYTTTQILKNLNANGGDGGNNGGLWLASGNGVTPDYVTLSIGGNDYGANGSETTAPLKRTDAIVSQIQSLRPDAHVIVSNLFFRTQNSGGNVVGDLQNTYYNPGVEGMVFNHVLAGQHVSFYDAYSAVTPGNNMSTINDGIHPTTVGYNAFADGWYGALANGSAFWTGSSGGTWNNQANFAQNYQLTTARQTAPGASTDVHFNSNASPLSTNLGQNTSVRSVNFAAGATGSVTVGGANALTLGAGGITVQAGTGAHTVSSNVVLGTAQTWGNVSSNALTVGGEISGSAKLNLVGSYTVELPGTLVGNTYTTTSQTVSGSGGFVLNGANSYSGGTTINAVTVGIGHNTAFGSGTVTMNNGATLANNSVSALTVGNGFSVSGSTNGVTFTGSQNLTLNGTISGGSGVKFTKTGTSVLTLSADNSATLGSGANWNVTGGNYNSSTGLYDNVIAINMGQNLGNSGSNSLNLNGGTLRFNANGGAGYSSARTINVLSGGGSIDDGGFAFGEAGGGGVVSPGINISSGATLSLVSSNSLVLTGTIGGTGGGVSKFGNGTAVLGGTNTYTGATNIVGGTLALSASGSISNSSGVSLGVGNTFDVSAKGGSGYTVKNLSGTGDVVGTLNVSSLLGIGNSAGTVTFDNLTLGSGATYLYEMDSTANTADLGIVHGNLSLTPGATLGLVQLGTFEAGDKFTLFAYETLTGEFAGIADDTVFSSGGDWLMNYNDTTAGLNGGTITGNAGSGFVTITVIPEPGAALLGGLSVLALLLRRRRQAN